MRTIHIINITAGKGYAEKYLKDTEIRQNAYITKGIYDAERYVAEECKKDPFARFVVYGGDGTANEVLNGIMRSGANETAQIKIIPTGTGNDFVKSFKATPEEQVKRIDVIKYNDRYALNIINFGFDCNVVIKTQKYKKLPAVSGSMAYILGVADMLTHKLGERFEFDYTDESGKRKNFSADCTLCAVGKRKNFSADCTLCAVANGKYYGGGFKAAPVADPEDGMLDLMIVKSASRAKFLSLVSDYKAGRHIDSVTNKPTESFKHLISYIRCKSVTISGLSDICADGEIEKISAAEISVVPKSINFVF